MNAALAFSLLEQAMQPPTQVVHTCLPVVRTLRDETLAIQQQTAKIAAERRRIQRLAKLQDLVEGCN